MKNFSPPKILVVALLSLLSLTSRALPFVPTTDPLSSTTHWYQIKSGNFYLYCDDLHEVNASSGSSTADDYLWCFVGTESTGYKILNRSSRYYMNGLSVEGLPNIMSISHVEMGSGNNFYIWYLDYNQKMYLCCDLDIGVHGEPSKVNDYTVNEVNAGTLPPAYSDPPELLFKILSDRCAIQLMGWGEGSLYVDGSEVANPYTIMRTNVDVQVTATATLQQPARLPSTVTETFTIPKLQLDVNGDVTGDGLVDIADVNAVINMMLGKTSQTEAGDVTVDSSVDIADVNAVINIMLGKDAYSANGVKFKMIDVEGGTFTMGNDDSFYSRHKPAHEVTVSSFKIGQTEVTQELWQAVMGNNPSWHEGTTSNIYYGTNLQRPVEQVSWYDCQEFITKLNQITGKTFRLPTEAEWEYAARGGKKSQGFKFAGSDYLDEVAYYWTNSGPEENPSGAPKQTHPVAQKQPNELGLYDMSGNVWEWCHDWYSGTYYSESPTDNPTGPASGDNRVVRGSSYYSSYHFYEEEEEFTVWFRNDMSPEEKERYTGLRLVLGNPLPEPTAQSLTAIGYNVPHNSVSNTGDEGYAKLVDGNRNTKWCVANPTGAWETIWIDLKSNVAFKPTTYILTTGNDTQIYYRRNPKNWKIYGRNSDSETWTELVHVTDGGGLAATNTTDYSFQFNGITKAYQYYRFEVLEVVGADQFESNYYAFQLAELTLLGVAAQ